MRLLKEMVLAYLRSERLILDYLFVTHEVFISMHVGINSCLLSVYSQLIKALSAPWLVFEIMAY